MSNFGQPCSSGGGWGWDFGGGFPPLFMATPLPLQVDYDSVSEKVLYPLWMGTVPVYIGAPNIDNFVPPRSIIKVTDFPSIPALAAYLKCLVYERPDLYDYYLQWRNRTAGYWERLQRMVHPFCRACQLVAEDSPQLRNISARAPKARYWVWPEAQGLQRPFEECIKG